MSEPILYLALVVTGFALGAYGRAARSPILIAAGIALVVLAVILFQLQAGGPDSRVPPGA